MQIDVKALRIGNIMQDQLTKTYLEVDELTRNENKEYVVGFYVLDRSTYPLPRGWQAVPVLLTEEVLLKCGFVYRNDRRGSGALMDLNNEDWKRSFCVGKIPGREGFTHLGSDRVDLLYLHQLQNLYFAISGFELNTYLT